MKNRYKVIILLTAVVFIALGIIQQEHQVVWKKAVNICLECVGIG